MCGLDVLGTGWRQEGHPAPHGMYFHSTPPLHRRPVGEGRCGMMLNTMYAEGVSRSKPANLGSSVRMAIKPVCRVVNCILCECRNS